MNTQCTQKKFEFQGLERRRVEADFSGGSITSDGGGLLLREVEARCGILRRFAECFADHRDEDAIEHTVLELIGQRVYGLALGYEDLNDHDDLRHDPLLATLVGKKDPTGEDRERARDKGKPLAGKSTLNRLELTPEDATAKSRYKKIVADEKKLERCFVDVFIQLHKEPPKRIELDLDATDDPLHGAQEGRFFHGYYKEYCYLPLYMFCGDHLLGARLRPSNIDASKGSEEELDRIVGQIRESWPKVEILVRGDSGFCREPLIAWCEENEVDYVLGIAKNSRLKQELAPELAEAKRQYEETGQASRVYKDFTYRTLKTWSRERRVVGKAEHLEKGSNPRFVVTSLSAEDCDAREVYEDQYCIRGDMENRIKEQQLCLFADRTSTSWMRSNQLRLWFSSIAYTLINALRHLGLKGTGLERAQCSTIRLKLLKIGALVKISCRRVVLLLATGCPYQGEFASAYRNVKAMMPLRC
ncbi:IS1380 family transposase [Acidobacteriota bacterium]